MYLNTQIDLYYLYTRGGIFFYGRNPEFSWRQLKAFLVKNVTKVCCHKHNLHGWVRVQIEGVISLYCCIVNSSNTDLDSSKADLDPESDSEEECDYEIARKKRIAENQAAFKTIMNDVLPLEVK